VDAKQFIESGILETYAMGLASEQEVKQVAEMIARYPEVKAELHEIEVSLENFDSKNAVEPPSHLKAKILAKVSGSQVPVSGNGKADAKVVSIAPAKQSNFFKYAAAILLLAVAGGGIYILMLQDALSTYRDLATKYDFENDELNRQLQATSDSVKQMNSEIALLKTPSMKSIELKGMDVAPDSKAMAYANTSTGEVYLEIMNLPAAPDGMQYQFWGIVDGKPVTAGMIPLSDTSGIHAMTTVPNAVAYAISLEPKGGSQQPTGKIYVMGNS
jgi:anti-sigma-K factor RskA